MTTVSSNPLIAGLAGPARDTRTQLAILGQELSTGEVADRAAALNRDFSALGLVERDLAIADGLRLAIGRGQRVGQAAQTAIAGIETQIADVQEALTPYISGAADAAPGMVARRAEAAFEQMIDLMNTRQDEGAVFGAGRGDADAVATSDTVLADLRNALVGASDADDALARTTAFFAGGGPFETTSVTPGSDGRFAFRIDRDSAVEFELRADDPRFLSALEQVAKVLVISEGGFAGTPEGRSYLAIDATADLATATDGTISLGAQIGTMSASLDRAADTLDADVYQAQLARNDLIGADPYETATRLQEETARLETIYTLTARLSGLRLTSFL